MLIATGGGVRGWWRRRQAPFVGLLAEQRGRRRARRIGTTAAPFYVEAQTVKVDLTEGAQVILASGVAAGDQVVIDGQENCEKRFRGDATGRECAPGGGGR